MADAWAVALPLGAQLGEGLHWDAGRSQLWMTDIHDGRVIRWDLASTSWQEWCLPQRVGWVIPFAAGEEVLLGLQQGFASARLDDLSALRWLSRPFEGNAALRLNDAKADPAGAVWAGSMNNDDPARGEGCLFRLDVDGSVSTHDTDYEVANGPAISPDGLTLLHTDSGRRRIYRFDLDAGAGRLTNKRLWKQFADAEGDPDGMCFDADGCLWVAHWGGSCISRFDSEGRLLRRIELPALQVTNVCFAGQALDRLFVSSARVGLGDDALKARPLSGSLFEVDAGGVRGIAGRPYGRRPCDSQATRKND